MSNYRARIVSLNIVDSVAQSVTLFGTDQARHHEVCKYPQESIVSPLTGCCCDATCGSEKLDILLQVISCLRLVFTDVEGHKSMLHDQIRFDMASATEAVVYWIYI